MTCTPVERADIGHHLMSMTPLEAIIDLGRVLELHEGRKRVAVLGLSDRVALECGDAREWATSGHDVACLIGEQEVYGGSGATLEALFARTPEGGKVVIGTPYCHREDVPQVLIDYEGDLPTEKEIFDLVRDAGCHGRAYAGPRPPAAEDREETGHRS